MRLVLSATCMMAVLLLGAARTAPALGHAIVSFVPCRAPSTSSIPRVVASIQLGLANFSAPYYDYQRTFDYRVVLTLPPPHPVDLAFDAPTGTYEMYVSVAGTLCTSQTYVTVLAGHTIHVNRTGIAGAEDPLTVATAAGTIPADAHASIVDIPIDAPCGAHVLGASAVLPDYGSIQDGAYYVMVPYEPKSNRRTTPALKLDYPDGPVYVRVPLRYDAKAKLLNGSPTFTRYDVTPDRLAGFSGFAMGVAGPVMCPAPQA